jgi:3-ketosteroid 9alpha-monooxygenase subunit A
MEHGPLGPFPRGWFVVGWSSDVAPGEVLPIRYFAQDLVLWRTASGEARVSDAFCPHLGAHLGHGGHVEDDCLVCPFHHWKFGPDGACVSIPYAKKVPPKARIASWTVVERNGAVFAWFDPAGGPPRWEVPTIPYHGSPDWTPWHCNRITAKTHPREIVENVADKQHFPTVHRTFVERFDNHYDGHMATQITKGTATPPQGGVDHFEIEATYYGPAFQISDMRGYLHASLFMAHTPIEANELHLRFAVSLERSGPRTESFATFYVENLRLGFHEDIAIWEHKVFRDRPQLVAEDGPVGRLRAWYRQFYRPVAEAVAK